MMLHPYFCILVSAGDGDTGIFVVVIVSGLQLCVLWAMVQTTIVFNLVAARYMIVGIPYVILLDCFLAISEVPAGC